ncbi:MAG: hypothetical protein EXX96DRAFT_627135 [Benjaminiella poitrasii]|nr:MAG: hypothetical protein EXX96DRAFT_627128 [Benjaminiella poitrasii]KAI9486690.1 MAG: hypothetical protein EXX96DRAFT_627135 [Benjaminiella poitrasii]
MFVGDRGLGIGSRLKGHLKYGGRWKPIKNSPYTSVLITNEHNSSQTCLFCYEKLSHPVGAMTNKKVTFLEFDPSISQSKAEMFNKNATDFLNKKRGS